METQEKYCTKEELENLDFTPRIEKLGITEKQFADKIENVLYEHADICGDIAVVEEHPNITKDIINYINSL